MVASSWTVRVDPASKVEVDEWLDDEKVVGYVIISDDKAVEIDFLNINDAFRFRLQFDQDLLA